MIGRTIIPQRSSSLKTQINNAKNTSFSSKNQSQISLFKKESMTKNINPMTNLQQQRSYAKSKKGSAPVNLAKGVYYKKNKKTFIKPKSSLPDEATPECFEHNIPHDYVLTFDIHSVTERRTPPVPESDFTKYDNKTWKKNGRRQRTLELFEAVELYPDLFPERDLFLPEFFNSLNVNLRVSYGNDFYDNVLLGNFLEAPQTLNPPSVEFPIDEEPENSKYTMVMVTPDYPFRLDSDEAPMIHWMISNIPGNDIKKGDTLVDYMPPLPSEYAGTFRYVFLLYRQPESMELNTQVNSLNDRRNFSIHQLADQFHLGLPVGMSFFRTEYDFCVTEKYRELNVKEPYYIPPDIRARQEVQPDILKLRHFSEWNI
eukprot:gb/GECH01011865.1/.p1 GENE.gb/GECH01011865.1/~~gb/GECH01011865.1/.p1  ORF type:complete len:371 (+),score=73.92 gb/GECH01011865.1/:1-1113(+)